MDAWPRSPKHGRCERPDSTRADHLERSRLPALRSSYWLRLAVFVGSDGAVEGNGNGRGGGGGGGGGEAIGCIGRDVAV